MAYLTGAVSLTAAPGGEYAPTQCFFPGVADVTVTSTTSSHSRASSSDASPRGSSGRQETVNPAVLRRSRRDVGSGIRIRTGSIAERGWCTSLNPPPDCVSVPEGACVWGWEK